MRQQCKVETATRHDAQYRQQCLQATPPRPRKERTIVDDHHFIDAQKSDELSNPGAAQPCHMSPRVGRTDRLEQCGAHSDISNGAESDNEYPWFRQGLSSRGHDAVFIV